VIPARLLRCLPALLLVSLFACGGAVYQAEEPPAPKSELRTHRPSSTAIWVDGLWLHRNNRYDWKAGGWIEPRPGFRWVPGYWMNSVEGWRFFAGHWEKN